VRLHLLQDAVCESVDTGRHRVLACKVASKLVNLSAVDVQVIHVARLLVKVFWEACVRSSLMLRSVLHAFSVPYLSFVAAQVFDRTMPMPCGQRGVLRLEMPTEDSLTRCLMERDARRGFFEPRATRTVMMPGSSLLRRSTRLTCFARDASTMVSD